MREIEAENKTLKGILPKNFARQELDKRMLGDVVDLFTNVKMAGEDGTQDVLGRTYKYCLAKFAEQEGKNAGEFYTPTCIVKTLVEIIEPYHGRVYDPCCGSGGMFVQSAKFVESHAGNISDISIFGQESNPTTWKMAKMNLAIRGIDADLGEHNADAFFNDLHKDKRFDFILANPLFNLKEWGGDRLHDDPRWEFGIPPEGNANFAWIQHMIHHLNEHGRMGMVLANGSLSSQTNNEGEIRKAIVDADYVEGIIAMPDRLFYSTGIPVSLWIIDKDKPQKGKMLFVDAREMGTMVSRALREFMPEDIQKVAKAFDAFREGTLEEEKGFSAVVTTEDIAKQDYILTPGRYAGIPDEEDDGEPFEEKMARLTGELSKCFEESNRLQGEIKKNLEAIGYGL
jgi:type I restriction enzyme M protein